MSRGNFLGIVNTPSNTSVTGVWNMFEHYDAMKNNAWPKNIPNIVTSGLIVYLDAGNTTSYPGTGSTWTDLSGNNNNFTLYNSPTFSSNKLIFNGTNQYAASVNNLNFTSLSSITTMIFARTTAITSALMFEHTANWNTNSGGLGLATHDNGNGTTANIHHTNHNTSVTRNYGFTIGTNWASHTNIFSSASDSTGRLTYMNGNLINFTATGGYATSTTTPAGSFANSLMYLCSRGGSSGFCAAEIGVFLIYNRKLSAAEVTQNFNQFNGRYGI